MRNMLQPTHLCTSNVEFHVLKQMLSMALEVRIETSKRIQSSEVKCLGFQLRAKMCQTL